MTEIGITTLHGWVSAGANSLWRASWQGALFILAVWLVCRLLPRLPAGIRCWLWWLACLKLLLGLVGLPGVPLPLLPPAAPPALETAALAPPPAGPQKRPSNTTGSQIATRSRDREAASPTAVPETSPRHRRPGTVTGAAPAAWLSGLLPALLGLWLIGVGVQLGRTAWQFRAARRLTRSARPLEQDALQEEALQLGVLVGLSRPPTLLQAEAAPGPLVAGLLRPAVVLPPDADRQLSAGELRLALAHELAHLRRGDLLLAWIPGLAQILFYFHPLVWLACREWATAREAACDAAALQVTEAPPAEYGKLLLKLVAAGKGADVVPALGTTTSYHTLHGRLKMLQMVSLPPRRWARAGMGIVVALTGISVLPWRLTHGARGAPPPAGVVLRQVWANPENPVEVDPTGPLSPDGRLLACMDFTTDSFCIRDLRTGTNRALIDKPDGAIAARIWSPDSKQIAYTWINHRTGRSEIRTIALDGSPPRTLYRQNHSKLFPMVKGWSPDGKQLLALFQTDWQVSGSYHIGLVSTVDGSARMLKSLDWREPSRLCFSPDGRYITYDTPQTEDTDNRDIYLLATDGSREIPVVQHPASDSVPIWAPDGRLLFISDRRGTPGFWIVAVADGKPLGPPELVMANLGGRFPVGFTPDGSLYGGLFRRMFNVYTATLDLEKGVLGPPQLAGELHIGSNGRASWSPDGRYLAYPTRKGENSMAPGTVVTIQSVDGRERRELPLKLWYTWDLHWYPDGHRLLATGFDAKGREQAFRIDSRNGTATLLATLPTGGAFLHDIALSRDGKAVFSAGSGRGLRMRDLRTGQEKMLYQASAGTIHSPVLSPDGRKLAFAEIDIKAKTYALKIMPASGGAAREVCRMQDPASWLWRAVAWSPDGRSLVFGWHAGPENETWKNNELWRVAAAGGAPLRLGPVPDPRGLSMHPSGRQIAFSTFRSVPELWLLENLLPAPRTASAAASSR